MMDPKSHNLDSRDPCSDLGDLLRPAVEQIRQAPLPLEALDRALDRARRIDQPRRRPWLSRRASLVATALAASLLLALWFRFGSYPLSGYLAGPRFPRVVGEKIAQPPIVDIRPVYDSAPSFSPSPRMLFRPGGRVFAFGGNPQEQNLSVQLSSPGSIGRDWEHVQKLRDLSRSMPQVDRRSVEHHLRHRLHTGISSASIWTRDSRPMPQARVVTEDGSQLTLQGVKIEVLIEGPRGRTLVDHIFHNPSDDYLHGTFEFPLPDGATPSFFALFPGNQERGQVQLPKSTGQQALAVTRAPLASPQNAVRRISTECWGEPITAQITTCGAPAESGLEAPVPASNSNRDRGDATSTGATFYGKLRPVPGKSMIRVLVAYEETLPIRKGRIVYQYPLPTCHLHDLSVELQADARHEKDAVFLPEDAVRRNEQGKLTYARRWKNVTGAGVVGFQARLDDPTLQTTSGRQGEHYYLLTRVRPEFPQQAATAPFSRNAIFLLDTSAGEHRQRFDRSIKLLRCILETDPGITRFNILTFSNAAGWLEPNGWLTNDPRGREVALRRLDGIVLEGATDLSAVIDRLVDPSLPLPRRTPVHAFLLSDGRLTWGETDLPALAARVQVQAPWSLRWHCYQMGLGEEHGELFGLLTRNGGGVYRCASEAEIPAAAAAHRQVCFTLDSCRFEGGNEAHDLLLGGRRTAVYPGGDLLLAARFSHAGRATLVLEGRLGNKPMTQRFPVEIRSEGELAARGWGELAVGSLLSLGDPRLDALAVTYGTQFGVASRATVFTLANETLPRPTEEPLGKTDLGQLVEVAWAALGKAGTGGQRREWLQTQLERWVPGAARQEAQAFLTLMPESELQMPRMQVNGGVTRRGEKGAVYLGTEAQNRRAVLAILDESDRRQKAGDTEGAIRCLSGLLEHSHGDSVATRLMCYHLVAVGHASTAVGVLSDLLESAPTDPRLHRALALALADAERPARAALHYEAALALASGRGEWHAAARDEYAHLLRRGTRNEELPEALRLRMRIRLKDIDRSEPCALRYSLTWNNSAEVDFRVILPDGTEREATLPEDLTRGTREGPRSIQMSKAVKGEPRILVTLRKPAVEACETLATVQIVSALGTRHEKVQTRRVLLRREGEQVQVVGNQP